MKKHGFGQKTRRKPQKVPKIFFVNLYMKSVFMVFLWTISLFEHIGIKIDAHFFRKKKSW